VIDRLNEEQNQPLREQFKQLIQAFFAAAVETMDEVIEQNIAEDRQFLEEVQQEVQSRKHAARQRQANQQTEPPTPEVS